MSIEIILLIVVAVLLIITIFLVIKRQPSDSNEGIKSGLNHVNTEVARIDPLLRAEFSTSREEIQKGAKATREEVGTLFRNFGDGLAKNITQLTSAQQTEMEKFSGHLTKSLENNGKKTDQLISTFDEKTKMISDTVTVSAKENRTELTQALKSFEEKFGLNVKEFNNLQREKFSDLLLRQGELKNETAEKLDKIRETIENKLAVLQAENSKKLEEMRNTVDEKLQSTLEKRFNDSFQVISERLDQVHRGLGEMQGLASNVGDLKKVMSNVKSRGVLGEYQLANILEDLLTNEQYERNVKTKLGSGAIVEFAIKMPHGNNFEKILWLPVDSKFPKEDYEALVEAYEQADTDTIENLRKSFKAGIIKNAKDIREKYIDPPNTTEYGIMFLPFESLYAEVLRTPGLFELLQKDYKITVTGPTTLSALLNSLQMGFRTLAIEKRSGEVWDLLSAVKKEFGDFGTILEKTKRKLQEATNTIDKAGVRSRAIERQLRKVQDLPSESTISQIEEAIGDAAKDTEPESGIDDAEEENHNK